VHIDLFSEIQNPRPWTAGHEQCSFPQAIEQAKLANDRGYGCWWQVEHHGADEFSLSSAPELLLAAISQHTTRIRLGHAAVLAPMTFNHPIRVAERAATLDHLSNGRLELGLTKSTIPESMHNGAAAAAAWYTERALRFFEAAELFVLQTKRHQELLNNADRGGLTVDFLRAEADNTPSEAQMLIGRLIQGETVPPEEMCLQQMGSIPHKEVMKSIELIGDLIPDLAD
jgi:alkanesulfonate monooxygenase SsuD/methylene tetrahydromethanopterin reductase-like flavin-dependent oxidoreductase (luciferase family)